MSFIWVQNYELYFNLETFVLKSLKKRVFLITFAHQITRGFGLLSHIFVTFLTNFLMKKITIAIDGHSSCGKSTMAKRLARELGYIYVDTGAMYRTVTLYALREGYFAADGTIDESRLAADIEAGKVEVSFSFNEATGLPEPCLNGEVVEGFIRGIEVSNHVSPIAALPFVRSAMTAQQQRMGEEGGIVMDGRDIGTVVFPNAELKVFVTASAEVRAQRRYDELVEKGQPAAYDEILRNVQERDYIDSHREVAPLRQADDALLLDNSNLSREEQSSWLYEQAMKVINDN